jgi:hypothetical protein
MAAAKKKKVSKKQISAELQRAARDYQELCLVLHRQALWNVASHLKMAPEELEEEFAALT